MIDSIHVASSGLSGHQKGLKVISGNVANMNSPGFKGSQAQFTDVFLSQGGDAATGENLTPGGGLKLLQPAINFDAGELRDTGRELDMGLDGPAFFVVRNERGELFYTKNGRFDLDEQGKLILMDKGYEVMGLVQGGALSPISVDALRVSLPKKTTQITLSGNLSSTSVANTDPTQPEHSIGDIKVYDALGAERTLTLQFRVATVTPPGGTTGTRTPGTWDVVVMEGSSTLGTGQVKVTTAMPDPLADRFTFSLQAVGGQQTVVTVLLGNQVTGFSEGARSSLTKGQVDGNAGGTITKATFDDTGTLVVTYTNTLTAKGPKLAVAEFITTEALTQASGSLFKSAQAPRYLAVGGQTQLRSGTLELSNVDLTDQFSTMILVQRGFQASSQVLSTASEMIQSLYDLKGRR